MKQTALDTRAQHTGKEGQSTETNALPLVLFWGTVAVLVAVFVSCGYIVTAS